MGGINWNSASNYTGVNGFSGSPGFGLPNSKPDFGFSMPMCQPMPGPQCGVNFKPECNEIVAHVLRGLTAAVNLLLDNGQPGCMPNDCSPKQDSWCFPQIEYVPLTLPENCWQPNQSWSAPVDWKFDEHTVSQVQQMGRRFSDFLCN